ncbi:hypothetical protein ACJIZ3_019779 [Penstemon smallii]|uniref:Protein FAR1-RELATED SEQUENCE n=1 Tax=Penstemon smallii TaxID=265156 RepID=A0ABD3T3P4_9LAMI
MIRSKFYYCSKENVLRYINTNRTQCKAMITFEVDKNGLSNVSKFIREHNHELALSSSKHLLKSARYISAEKAATINAMINASLRPIDCFNYMTEENHGDQNMDFAKRDCYNFISMLKAALIEPVDAKNLAKYFKKGRIANIVWRDNKSRLDYDCFGVNYHWQNVMFGCAFLSDETNCSFELLSNTFLESMENKAPVSIFTDKDQAMANDIGKVILETCHRLFLWHILKNAPSNLNSFNSSSEFHRGRYSHHLV